MIATCLFAQPAIYLTETFEAAKLMLKNSTGDRLSC